MKKYVTFYKMPNSVLSRLEIAKIGNDHNKEGGDMDYCNFNVARNFLKFVFPKVAFYDVFQDTTKTLYLVTVIGNKNK